MKTSEEYNTNFDTEDAPEELLLSIRQTNIILSPLDTTQKKKLSKEDRLIKWGILKNVIVISFAFTCLFTSFKSIENLQSSINQKLGTISLAALYAAVVFSSLFIPSFLIKKLKVKWTISLSMLCYSTFMAAQFYPEYYTLVPTAIILGLGAAPMWTAKCTYLTTVGEQYAELIGEQRDVIITRFFGIFFLYFQSSLVIGSFISSTVLSQGIENVTRTQDFLDMCGANFCPDFGANLTVTSGSANVSCEAQTDEERSKRILMSAIYLVIALASSILIAVFVDSLARYGEGKKSSKNKSSLQLLMATFKHLKNPNQILIIPLTFWCGIQQAFLGADFTVSFVTCGLGVHMVGYSMIYFGVCDAICSLLLSPLVKLVGRVPVMILGFILNMALMLLMMFWKPDPSQIWIFYTIPALWGVSDAIWQTQINSLYGVLFPGESEAAFSHYSLWKCLGLLISYYLSSSICIGTKLHINMGVLAVGMVGYLTIELMEFRKKK